MSILLPTGFGAGVDGISPSGGSGGETIADLTTWASKPDGMSDGQYGLGPNGVVYRWKDAISRWIRAPFYGATFTQLGATLGASASPAGWTKTDVGGYITSDGTTLTINTTGSQTNQARLDCDTAPSAGAGMYADGYLSISNIAGTYTYQSSGWIHDDGTRRRNIGPTSTSLLYFANSTGQTARGCSAEPSVATENWVEYYAAAAGTAVIYVDHAKEANLFIKYTTNEAVGTQGLLVGDPTANASSLTTYRDFRFYNLS